MDRSDAQSSYLTPLLNDLYAMESPVFLVLDDYHLIDKHAVHESMTFLLESGRRAGFFRLANPARPCGTLYPATALETL